MKSVFLFIGHFIPLLGLTQTWKFDTTRIAGENVRFTEMLAATDYWEVSFSDGRLFVSGRAAKIGLLPYFYMVDTRDAKPVAKSIPFKGFPSKIYQDTNSGNRYMQSQNVYIIPDRNRILWNNDWSVVVTDTNYKFIKHIYEPYSWKHNKDRYFMDKGLQINSDYYIRFVNSTYERKNYHGKREGISRFGKYLAPGLPDDQFPGIRFSDVNAVFDTKKTKIKPGPQMHFEKCDTVHSRWAPVKYAMQLADDSVLWFVDDFSRNLVRYHIPSNRQVCYSFMQDPSPFLCDDAYDIVPQKGKMNESNEIEYRKLHFYDLHSTIIHHAERGRIAVIEDESIFVDEHKDLVVRTIGINTNDSILLYALRPYFSDASAFTPGYTKRMAFLCIEFRELSTMELTHFIVIPARHQVFMKADAQSFTIFDVIRDGDVPAWAFIKASFSE